MKAKRIACAILCLTMAFALLPAAALAGEPTGVWVGGTEVVVGTFYLNDGSGGVRTDESASDTNYNVHYDNGILTLNNASITKNHVDSALGITAAIYSGRELTINLIGSNTLSGASGELPSVGLGGMDKLTIEGNGDLTAHGGHTRGAGSLSSGVFGVSVTISDTCTVTAIGGDAPNGDSYGVYGISVTIEDTCTVTAKSGETSKKDGSSNGVHGGYCVNITGGSVEAVGGPAKVDEEFGYSNGVFGGNFVSITGGTVEAAGGPVTIGSSYGVYGGSSVSITGGTVETTGGIVSSSTSQSCGLYGIRVIIQDGMITARGSEADTTNGYSYGVYGGDSISITGGRTEATGGKAGKRSCGMTGYNAITISDGTVTAIGAESGSNDSYGLYAPSTDRVTSISISGGKVDATGVTAGVKAGRTCVTSGTLTAHGDHALARTANSADDCFVIGPAGPGKGFMCRISDALAETNWSAITPDDMVCGTDIANFSSGSDYYTKPSVRISGAWAVSGTVKEAAGHPADDFLLYLDGVFSRNYDAAAGSGAYTVYSEDGGHLVSAEKGTQIGSVRVSVDGAVLSGQNITLGKAAAPGITVTPAAVFPQGGAPGRLTLLVGSTGNPPNGSAHFDSLEISSDNANFTTVDRANYSLHYGSIRIELSQTWLNSLSPGTYTLRVNLAGAFQGMSQTSRITVAAVPETGDANTPLLWLGLALLCGAGLAVSVSIKRRAAKGRQSS